MKKMRLLTLFMCFLLVNSIFSNANDINVNLKDVTVGIDVTDDQTTPGVIISRKSVGVIEGGTAIYTIKLSQQPSTDNIIITPSTSSSSVATVSGALTFTNTNWNTAQDVTVTGVEDADLRNERTTILHTIAGSDSRYTVLSLAKSLDVSVVVYDNDVSGVTLSEFTFDIAESSTDSYTVVLNKQPTADVIIKVLSSDVSVATLSSQTLTFTVSDWNTAQTVTITTLSDDDGVDNPVTINHSVTDTDTTTVSSYESVAIDDIVVTIKDDDTNGVTVADVAMTPAAVGEGDSEARYTVVLDTEPVGGDVTVTVGSSNVNALTVSPGTLTFTDDNWNVAQTVTVAAVEDDDAVDESVNVSFSFSGANYDEVADIADKTVAVTDDEETGIILSTTAVDVVEDKTVTYTIALSSQPKKIITITPSSVTEAVATVATPKSNSKSLLFTTTNWDVAQTVTITGVNDGNEDADASPRTSKITHTVASADDSGYTDGLIADATNEVIATVKEAGVVGVSVSTLKLSITEGDTATYTIVLTKKPTAETVTITVSEDSDAVSLKPSDKKKMTTKKLTFTKGTDDTDGTWNVPQTVTITASDDDNSVNESVSITHTITISMGTGGYAGVTIPDVVVTLKDDDIKGVSISATELTMAEGEKVTYTIVLDTKPSANVTITPVESDITSFKPATLSFLPATITLTATNWNVAQTVTITGIDDDDAADEEKNITYTVATVHSGTTDDDYTGVTTGSVDVTVTDDETAGITLSATRLTVAGGGDVTYTIVLNTPPKDPVTIRSMSSDGDVSIRGTRRDYGAYFTVAGVAIWNMPQTITLSAAAFNTDKDVTISHKIEGSREYKVLTIDDVLLAVKTKKAAGVVVSATKLRVDEDDTSTTHYTVVLTKEPTGNVIIRPESEDTDVASVSPTDLAFTPINWNTAQTVNIIGVQDEDSVDETTMITHRIEGASEYASITVDTVEVAVTDDETAGITISPTPITIPPTTGASPTPGRILYEGKTITYTVKLDSKPVGTASVNITLTTDKTTAIELRPTRLSFNSENWNTEQIVTITGKNDLDAKDETVAITHTVAGAANSGYEDIVATKTIVTVTDDDTGGITFSKTKFGVIEGGMTTYTVVLDTKPSADVTITPTSSAATVVTVKSAKLTFTTDNWDTAQTITLNSVQNTATVDAATASTDANIVHDITTRDIIYTALIPTTIVISVLDDDSPRVIISSIEFSVTERSTGTYTIVLSKKPTAAVNITPVVPTADQKDISISPLGILTFTAEDTGTGSWNVPQTITVTASPDTNADDKEVMITHTVATTESGSYRGVKASDVTVSVKDTDTKGATITRSTLSIDEGSRGSYAISLSSRPSANVTITVGTGTSTAVKLTTGTATTDLTQIVFSTGSNPTNGSWRIPKTVIVTAIKDESAVDDVVTITHTVLADSGGYETTTSLGSVVVTVNDIDIDTGTSGAGIIVSDATLSIDEGDSAIYTIVLNSEPTGDVTISLDSDRTPLVGVSPTSIVFTKANWFDERVIHVTAVDNDEDAVVAMKSAVIRHRVGTVSASEYRSESIRDVTVTVNDDDMAGVTLSKSRLKIIEPTGTTPETNTYTVVLNSKPMAAVTITPSSSDGNLATVSGELTFTVALWDTPQTVTISALGDNNVVNDRVTISHPISVGYTDTVGNVEVTITDTAAGTGPGVTFAPDNSDTDTTRLNVNENGIGTYTIVLSNKPVEEATITPSSNDENLATVSGELIFTITNWNIPQNVTVTGVQDDNAISDQLIIEHTISGGGTVKDIYITVVDDDIAGVTASTTSIGITAGNVVSYTVVLDSKPSGDVTITPGVGTGLNISPSSHTFTPDNWDTPRTFELTSSNAGDSTVLNVITSSDASYQGQGDVDISIVTYDSNIKGLSLSKASLSIIEGNTKTYTIALTQKPSATVTVKPTPPAKGVAGVGVVTVSTSRDDNTLIFTILNWNRVQTVTVMGVDDADSTNYEMATINHVITGDDDDYKRITSSTIAATVKESPPVIILLGEATVTITVGSVYTDAGARVKDNVDGTQDLVGVGTVDVNVNEAGRYIITYNATDAAGNAAARVLRTVIVVAETAESLTSTGSSENEIGGDITKGNLAHISVEFRKEYTSVVSTINTYDKPISAAQAAMVGVPGTTTTDNYLNINGEAITFVEGAVYFSDVTINDGGTDLTDNSDACRPCNVAITYDDISQNIDEDDLAIYVFDRSAANNGNGEWKVLATTVDTTAKTVTATTQVLYSVFAVGVKLTELLVVGKRVIFNAKEKTIEIEFNKEVSQNIDLNKVIVHTRVGPTAFSLVGATVKTLDPVEDSKIVIALTGLQKGAITASIEAASGTTGRLAETTRIDIQAGAVEDASSVEIREITGIGIVVEGRLGNIDFELIGASVWPIPTSDDLKIKIDEKADYRLINIRGQVLKRGALTEGVNSVNISLLSKGIYFLNIRTNKGSLTKKVVRN